MCFFLETLKQLQLDLKINFNCFLLKLCAMAATCAGCEVRSGLAIDYVETPPLEKKSFEIISMQSVSHLCFSMNRSMEAPFSV